MMKEETRCRMSNGRMNEWDGGGMEWGKNGMLYQAMMWDCCCLLLFTREDSKAAKDMEMVCFS